MPVSEQMFMAGMAKLRQRWPDQSLKDLPMEQARKATREEADRYFEDVGQVLSDGEWVSAVTIAIQRSTFFPRAADLLKPILDKRERKAATDGPVAFDLVVGATVHALEHAGVTRCSCVGDRYDHRLLAKKFGEATARAFLQAGGEEVFATMTAKDEPFVRKRFVDAYREEVKVAPMTALPAPELKKALAPPPAPKQISDGDDRPLTPEESRKFVEQIRKPIEPHAISIETDEEWEARKVDLKRQAEERGA